MISVISAASDGPPPGLGLCTYEAGLAVQSRVSACRIALRSDHPGPAHADAARGPRPQQNMPFSPQDLSAPALRPLWRGARSFVA